MSKRCPACGLKFEREPGYFFGAMYVSYFLSVGILGGLVILGHLVFPEVRLEWLALAAMVVGIPYGPISPAYSLMSSDFGKLRAIVDLLTPGMVFANDGGPFARALYTTVPDDIELVVTRNPLGDRKTLLPDPVAIWISSLCATPCSWSQCTPSGPSTIC